MDFKKIALFSFLCLPVYVLGPDSEEVNNKATVNHKDTLSDIEHRLLEKKLQDNADEEYYKNSLLKTEYYIHRVHKLQDNDIKRYIINPDKMKELNNKQLTDLQQRLEQRIQEEQGFFASKGLRTDLEALQKKVKQRMELRNLKTPNTSNQSSFQPINNQSNEDKNNFTNPESKASTNTTNQKQLKHNLSNTLNYSGSDLEGQDALSKENTTKFETLKNKISEIKLQKFIDFTEYTKQVDPKEIIDPKIINFKEIIKELSEIKPQTDEIRTEINKLKKELEAHFKELTDKAFKEYNNAETKYLETNLKISELKNKNLALRPLDIFKEEQNIEKITQFIEEKEKEIKEYREDLKKYKESSSDFINILYQIKRLENDIKEEDLNRKLAEKAIKQPEQENNQAINSKTEPKKSLETLEQDLRLYAKDSSTFWSLKRYFEDQAKEFRQN